MIRVGLLSPDPDASFPPVEQALRDPNGLLAVGGDLAVGRLLNAYRHGIFPWYSEGEPILWWSPDPRMVFDTDRMHVPRRLARWLRSCEWQVCADRDFAGVMRACAEPRAYESGTWITEAMHTAYQRLHTLGHAHSVEVYAGADLIGGIYGVAVGRMFFGESMFSRRSNVSKVGLLGLAHALARWGYPLLDAQLVSAHLATLGAYALSRPAFCAQVAELTALPGIEGSWQEHFPALSGKDLFCR